MVTGDEIRRARLKSGLTQEKLAEKTNYSPRQIGRFENNENLEKCNKYINLLIELGILQFYDEENLKECRSWRK